MNAWLVLGVAIAAELVATSALKASHGFTKLVPVVVMVAGYAISFFLLSVTLKELPLGIVYAVWSGIGTVGVAIIGLLVWRETLDVMKGAGIALVVVGVVLINLKGSG
jgi:small multidrug resistance pump